MNFLRIPCRLPFTKSACITFAAPAIISILLATLMRLTNNSFHLINKAFREGDSILSSSQLSFGSRLIT